MICGKKDLLAETLEFSGVSRVLRATGSWRGLVVLNYHRIGRPEESPLDRGVFSATVAAFDAQVCWLKRQCDVIGLDRLDEALADRCGRYALLTFDDGYDDNHALAYPVLKQHGVSATFFITTGFLDQRRVAWWDEVAWIIRHSRVQSLTNDMWFDSPLTWRAADPEPAIRRALATYKRLPQERTEEFLNGLADGCGCGRCPAEVSEAVWMRWDMVREMHRGGMFIGGHTVTHPVLSRCDAGQQEQEIVGCKARLEAELGAPIEAFSYPVGQRDSFDGTTRRRLEQAGFRWGFSFYGGYVRPRSSDRFDLPRVAVEPGLTPSRFRGLVTLPQVFAGK